MVQAKQQVKGYFKPDEILFISIGNMNYAALRTLPAFGEWADLPEVGADMQSMERGMRGYGLSRPDIIQEQDASYDTIKELIDGARHKI